jgi:hypothetical protein
MSLGTYLTGDRYPLPQPGGCARCTEREKPTTESRKWPTIFCWNGLPTSRRKQGPRYCAHKPVHRLVSAVAPKNRPNYQPSALADRGRSTLDRFADKGQKPKLLSGRWWLAVDL